MNWEKKDIINICKILAFGIILYWALNNLGAIGNAFGVLGNILSPFIAGAAIAFVINIPMTIFEKKVFVSRKKKKKTVKISKIKRVISIILSLAIIILIIVGVTFLVIPELINIITNIIRDDLPVLFENIKNLTNQAIVEYPQISQTLTSLQSNLENINSEIIRELTGFGTSLVTYSFGMISSALSMIVNLVISIIFEIYVLMSKEKLVVALKKITYAFFEKDKADKICEIANLSRESFYNFITGQLLECIILGSLCALGMFILRLPYSATVGTVIAITAFVPIVGALIGGVIGAILIMSISFNQAIVFIIFFIILQQTENNLIYPKVVGGRVGVPGILVLIAVAIGGSIGGAIGMVVCLPITSVLYTLLRASTDRRLKEKELENI